MTLSLVLLAGISPRSERTYVALVIVYAIGALLTAPFYRRIGGAGGGSEKAIVGITWFLLALATGIFFAQNSSEGVG